MCGERKKALGRRIRAYTEKNDTDWTVREFYYNSALGLRSLGEAGWQLLEVRKDTRTRTGTPLSEPSLATTLYEQYVWSARYIDSPILRDRDADGNPNTGNYGKTGSGLEERLYYLTDANMNVTTLVDTGGDAIERYVYDPYGKVTIYDDDWSETRQTSSYDNNILYCGYYYDWETGLYHVRRRYLHSYLSWLQRDPIGYGDGMSLYEYARNAPTARTDPRGIATTVAPPTPEGLNEATESVKKHAEQLESTGSHFYVLIEKTEDGTFHFVGALFGTGNQFGVMANMDFVPSEETSKCCSNTNVIQMIKTWIGGEPNYGADWHTDEEGKETETGRAEDWSVNGAYIERSHEKNTPFMAGTSDATGEPMGKAGGGSEPLEWEDAPQGWYDPWSEKTSGQNLVTCAVCREGYHAGKVYGCIRWGWVYEPPREEQKSRYWAFPPEFHRSIPPDMQWAIDAWNKKTPADWPKISVE